MKMTVVETRGHDEEHDVFMMWMMKMMLWIMSRMKIMGVMRKIMIMCTMNNIIAASPGPLLDPPLQCWDHQATGAAQFWPHFSTKTC